jgi:predicted kinase
MIIDDTHCYKDYLIWMIGEIRDYANKLERPIHIEIIDFDIPTDECVKRNKCRENQVEEIAIFHMKTAKDQIDFNSLLIDKYTKILI